MKVWTPGDSQVGKTTHMASTRGVTFILRRRTTASRSTNRRDAAFATKWIAV